VVLEAAAPGKATAAASSEGTTSDLDTVMKQRGRRNSKVTAPDVVDLVSDSDADADAEDPPAQPSRRRSKGRAAAAAAAAAIAGSTQATAARDAPADDEFIDSDFELDEEPQPKQQQQQAAAGGGRKRTFPATQPVLECLKAPKRGLGVGSGAATAAAAEGTGKALAQGPAAKRAKTGAVAAAGAGVKGGSKAPSGAGSRAARSKQAAAKVTFACGISTTDCTVMSTGRQPDTTRHAMLHTKPMQQWDACAISLAHAT
jgi:hypothetical protein